jgi:hypothetical protein
MALGSAYRVPAGSAGCPGVGLSDVSSGPAVHLARLWTGAAASVGYRWSKAPVTERFEPQAATTARIDLGSFPQIGVVVVFGAGGRIGGALVETIRATQKFEHVVAFSRSTSPSIDLLDEASLERATAFAADQGELRLVIDATGFLHDNRQEPEKSWRQLDGVNLPASYYGGISF